MPLTKIKEAIRVEAMSQNFTGCLPHTSSSPLPTWLQTRPKHVGAEAARFEKYFLSLYIFIIVSLWVFFLFLVNNKLSEQQAEQAQQQRQQLQQQQNNITTTTTTGPVSTTTSTTTTPTNGRVEQTMTARGGKAGDWSPILCHLSAPVPSPLFDSIAPAIRVASGSIVLK